ncbi:hypothetical protein A3B50_00545 [Candidatus Roizmanbacteria bacterium RIFCSPLOWO2_01_FULL_40_42]|uniref:Tryptophan synthase beta chain-like PALP domain-containing protein n=1 Tax=Candidatus Roizmanbacteria bacterium RIFCSPLOWO2_01_FULL_40_42 TaxID=1802066 RepID=A0A1F7J3T4_9BACT|nr:MAG: hypothetical protein A2779_01450 [Candidatus Roizmanbacteria bacterium RIFCSPHIGHO2_01_FULL_40_98]OGK29025.1 MAG: hypothetical protein A3C31_02090 [Candidatus Roizmanbacteria bacterium RIFCSPHIGHO2_02_FULL_40_53]OGK29978.1 MAG: hypothetical protein A2W49_00120 [Candidatus Roizmanbacteria bacterium RIFCSPHIGHO2_12_41_18]OGK37313.1 MAG: hypothetical protein A3E69_04390 [Candidatus Roizmanbacteria bacterium RIFCSPHIGHO2_12_FULL_40_130]OGK50255.1 MAG: hypothetical protein A3B50_00545 [Candi
MNYSINCIACGHLEKVSIISCSRCSKGLEVKLNKQNEIYNSEESLLLRYRSFLPLSDKKILGRYPNSSTPVIQIYKKNVYAKLEYCTFSASSKDREAFIEIVMAQVLGYKGIVVASTGNMGGALASLCAMFKFPCIVLIPEDTSRNKIRHIEQFGAVVKKVPGTYDDIVPKAIEFANKENMFLASLQAFRFEGYKTIAYELFEKFGKNLPKNIIVPLGDGTTYVGIWKGFKDLKNQGLIDSYPSLIGVQAKQCDPIVSAYINKSPIKFLKNPNTIAQAIRIGNPLDGDYSLRVVEETRGQMFSFKENQILEAQSLLLKEGVDAEFTSALTFCPILFKDIGEGLLLITGPGFKN